MNVAAGPPAKNKAGAPRKDARPPNQNSVFQFSAARRVPVKRQCCGCGQHLGPRCHGRLCANCLSWHEAITAIDAARGALVILDRRGG